MPIVLQESWQYKIHLLNSRFRQKMVNVKQLFQKILVSHLIENQQLALTWEYGLCCALTFRENQLVTSNLESTKQKGNIKDDEFLILKSSATDREILHSKCKMQTVLSSKKKKFREGYLVTRTNRPARSNRRSTGSSEISQWSVTSWQ